MWPGEGLSHFSYVLILIINLNWNLILIEWWLYLKLGKSSNRSFLKAGYLWGPYLTFMYKLLKIILPCFILAQTVFFFCGLMNIFIYIFISVPPTRLCDIWGENTFLEKCPPLHVSCRLIEIKVLSTFASSSILPDARVTLQSFLYFLRFSYAFLPDISHCINETINQPCG